MTLEFLCYRDEEKVSDFGKIVGKDAADFFRETFTYWRALGIADEEVDRRTSVFREELRVNSSSPNIYSL